MFTQKIIVWSLVFLSIFWVNWVFAEEWWTESCEYLWKFEQCVVANQNGTSESIEEFVCPPTRDRSKILDQVILSTKFQEIDTEVLLFLDELRNNKQRILDEPNAVIDDVWYYLSKGGYYYRQYQQVCNSWLLAERLRCTNEIPNVVWALYLDGWNYDGRPCMSLVETKTIAHNWVANNIILMSKWEVQNDTKQLFRQEERERYNLLMDLIRVILGQLERLANGITHWTENPY